MLQIRTPITKELKLVEYPGIVKNVENMLETLGTSTKTAFTKEGKRLEIRFHPKNPFNKPISSDVGPKMGLLLSLKVRKYKSKTRPDEYHVSVIGFCNKSYSFSALADFQYLPISKHSGKWESIHNIVIPKKVTDNEYFLHKNAPLFCLPQAFARTDSYFNILARNDAINEQSKELLGINLRLSCEYRDATVFNLVDAFPARPQPEIAKRLKVKYVSDEQLEKVKQMFQAVPIWTRVALKYESGLSNDKLKCIIPSIAYYFSTGPWRTLYVRYGYDPRKDFASRYYQIFDFRIRFLYGASEMVDKLRTAQIKSKENADNSDRTSQDANYPYFDENKLPRARQCILRYCDIRIPKIQDMLSKIPEPMACNERTGWLPSCFDGQVRQMLSNVLKGLLQSRRRKEQQEEDPLLMDIDEITAESLLDENDSISSEDCSLDV